MKHTTLRLRAMVLALLCIFGLAACSKISGELPSSLLTPTVHSREYYSSIKGSGKDSWLLMVYLNAADAEAFGLASHALSQLLTSDPGPNITVVVQTFGADAWQGEFVSQLSDRIRITDTGVYTAAYGGDGAPGSAEMLEDFVSTCRTENSANRAGLILWGEQSLSSPDMAEALEDAELDFLALNTAPTRSFEDAYLLRDTADYLIASAGDYAVSWDFSSLITALKGNTSFLCQDIARLLGDGVLANHIFVDTGTAPGLYCTDLTCMEYAYEGVSGLLGEAVSAIEEEKFAGVAVARAAAAEDNLRVDLRKFAETFLCEASAACIAGMDACMVYPEDAHRSLSLYLPINASVQPDFPEVIARWAAHDLDYTAFLPAYLTAAACAEGTGSAESWFINSIASLYMANSDPFRYDGGATMLYSNERFVLPMRDEDAAKLGSLRVATLADTGEHYLLLGDAPITERDPAGAYIVAPAGDEWLCINGQPVCSYSYVSADGALHSIIPCTQNDANVYLLLSGDQIVSSLQQMGVFTGSYPILTGDVLSFAYPAYSYTGESLGDKAYGYKIAVAEGLTVSYAPVDIGDLLLRCTLQDISGHDHVSPLLNIRTAMMG